MSMEEGSCETLDFGQWDNPTSGYDNDTSGYDNATSGYDNATSGYDNGTSGYDNGTSGYDNGTSGYDNATSGYDNGTSGYDNGTSGYDNGTSGYDNGTSGYDNGTSGYDQALPEMDTTQRTFYPPQPEYAEVYPDLEPGGMVNPPPHHINNPSEGTFSKPTVTPYPGRTHRQGVRLPFPQPNNRHQIIRKPPPMYNPGFLTPQITVPTAPGTVFPPPKVFPSPQSAMYPGMVPAQQYPQNFPVPGRMMANTVQPAVVTTQTTVISTSRPPCRDYLPWSIINLLCCCLCFGIVALFFSLQTRSAKKHQDWESAQRKSRVALGFNLAAMLLGIALIIIVPSVYFSLYHSSYYPSYYYPSYYYG